MNSGFKTILLAVLAIIGFFVPTLLGGSGAVYAGVRVDRDLAVMSYGLDIVVSDLGEVSLAHTVFFAVGAYTTALLSASAGRGPALSLAGAILMVLLVAAALGFVTLQLREFVFSLVTYAVAVVAATVAQNWDFLGGSDGLRGIPAFELSWMGFTARNDQELWPVAYLLLIAAIYLVSAFRRSKLGQAAMMVHLNQRLAITSGVDPQRIRLQVFLVSAPITAFRWMALCLPAGLYQRGRAGDLFPHPHADCRRGDGAPSTARAPARRRIDPDAGEVFFLRWLLWTRSFSAASSFSHSPSCPTAYSEL
jgi:branched-chain amino acid transport system permease protein